MDEFGNPTMHVNEFELHDFIDDPNFDQFIDLIRGENEDPVAGFDCDLINGCFADNQQFGSTTPQEDMFDYVESTMVSDLTSVINTSLSSLNEGVMNKGGDQEEEEEEDNDGDDSSGTTRSTRKTKPDRSKTLISERRRRGRMKEKLYALRSLVPNITKMDKASIVGDAVLYVQQLQMQASKLKAEIAGLEASLAGSERYKATTENSKKTQVRGSNLPAISKKIMQMEMFQVEERGFYLRLVSNKEEGVAISLYRAMESLTSFNIRNSNLATESERFVFTFTLNVRDCERSMNLPNLKLWVRGALLNQGFDVLTSA